MKNIVNTSAALEPSFGCSELPSLLDQDLKKKTEGNTACQKLFEDMNIVKIINDEESINSVDL